MAQLVERRLAGRQARKEIDYRLGTTGRSVPLSLQVMRRWREASANVLYECDCMIVCILENMKNKQKEWHTATKPLKKIQAQVAFSR